MDDTSDLCARMFCGKPESDAIHWDFLSNHHGDTAHAFAARSVPAPQLQESTCQAHASDASGREQGCMKIAGDHDFHMSRSGLQWPAVASSPAREGTDTDCFCVAGEICPNCTAKLRTAPAREPAPSLTDAEFRLVVAPLLFVLSEFLDAEAPEMLALEKSEPLRFARWHGLANETHRAFSQIRGAARREAPVAPQKIPHPEMDDETYHTMFGWWPRVCPQRAFVDGAKWWEAMRGGATMWQSDQRVANAEAVQRYGEPSTASTPATAPPSLVALVREWQEARLDVIANRSNRVSSIRYDAADATLSAFDLSTLSPVRPSNLGATEDATVTRSPVSPAAVPDDFEKELDGQIAAFQRTALAAVPVSELTEDRREWIVEHCSEFADSNDKVLADTARSVLLLNKEVLQLRSRVEELETAAKAVLEARQAVGTTESHGRELQTLYGAEAALRSSLHQETE